MKPNRVDMPTVFLKYVGQKGGIGNVNTTNYHDLEKIVIAENSPGFLENFAPGLNSKSPEDARKWYKKHSVLAELVSGIDWFRERGSRRKPKGISYAVRADDLTLPDYGELQGIVHVFATPDPDIPLKTLKKLGIAPTKKRNTMELQFYSVPGERTARMTSAVMEAAGEISRMEANPILTRPDGVAHTKREKKFLRKRRKAYEQQSNKDNKTIRRRGKEEKRGKIFPEDLYTPQTIIYAILNPKNIDAQKVLQNAGFDLLATEPLPDIVEEQGKKIEKMVDTQIWVINWTRHQQLLIEREMKALKLDQHGISSAPAEKPKNFPYILHQQQ